MSVLRVHNVWCFLVGTTLAMSWTHQHVHAIDVTVTVDARHPFYVTTVQVNDVPPGTDVVTAYVPLHLQHATVTFDTTGASQDTCTFDVRAPFGGTSTETARVTCEPDPVNAFTGGRTFTFNGTAAYEPIRFPVAACRRDDGGDGGRRRHLDDTHSGGPTLLSPPPPPIDDAPPHLYENPPPLPHTPHTPLLHGPAAPTDGPTAAPPTHAPTSPLWQCQTNAATWTMLSPLDRMAACQVVGIFAFGFWLLTMCAVCVCCMRFRTWHPYVPLGGQRRAYSDDPRMAGTYTDRETVVIGTFSSDEEQEEEQEEEEQQAPAIGRKRRRRTVTVRPTGGGTKSAKRTTSSSSSSSSSNTSPPLAPPTSSPPRDGDDV